MIDLTNDDFFIDLTDEIEPIAKRRKPLCSSNDDDDDSLRLAVQVCTCIYLIHLANRLAGYY